ncbi:MAG TPA: sugar kinase [Candidatus Wallbacteria bacterium]|nr:sugar kinase [Candidatus Wallbacteria bacterium]
MFDRIIVVTKKTPLEELIERFNTLAQAKFYIEHSGQSFAEYEAFHNSYAASLEELKRIIPREMKSQFIERGFLTNFLFGNNDLVMTLGPDGLVVNTAKYLSGQYIFAINPDRSKIDGVLLPFEIKNAGAKLEIILRGGFSHSEISMAKVSLDNGQKLYAVNDIFVGPKSHTSLRYTIRHALREEDQLSSGIIISTGAGSTGWLRAVVAGARGIVARHDNVKNIPESSTQFAWNSEHLVFSVREPFESKTSGTGIAYGTITAKRELTIISRTPSGGVIFSDGIENDYLEFNSGRTAVVTLAEKKVKLIINQ